MSGAETQYDLIMASEAKRQGREARVAVLERATKEGRGGATFVPTLPAIGR